MDLISLFREGGFIMYPLLICSILVWAVALEKIYFIHQLTKQFVDLQSKTEELIRQKKIHEARGLCHHAHYLLRGPFISLLEEQTDDKEAWAMRLGRRLKEGQTQSRRFLWILGTIGSSAPFIGLFGTVVGIIKSFDSIALSGKSGFNVVASGLSEALVATAAGIIVAVIAVVFYNALLVSIKKFDQQFKHGLEDLMDLLPNSTRKKEIEGQGDQKWP